MDDQLLYGTSATAANVGPTATGTAAQLAQKRLEAAHESLAEAEEALRVAHVKANEDLTSRLRSAAYEALAQKKRNRERAERDVEAAAGELAEARKQIGTDVNAAAPVPVKEESPLVYETCEEFLHESLLPLYNRIIDAKNGKWCRQWFLHPEAVSRVEALWRAWEHLRLDGATGMSVWWKDHADAHMSVLLNQKGPFHRCDIDRHRSPELFPCDMAPPGWFPKASELPLAGPQP